MSGYEFGEFVKVHARAVAVYGIATEVHEPTGQQASGWTISRGTGEWRVSEYEVAGKPEAPGKDGGWPGTAVPDTDSMYGRMAVAELEPYKVKGRHRRIRRLPLSEPAVGVVVGHTWRHEGTYEPGGGGYSYFNEDPSPPSLNRTRQIRVVQVALDTQGPAHVIDAWEEDVTA